MVANTAIGILLHAITSSGLGAIEGITVTSPRFAVGLTVGTLWTYKKGSFLKWLRGEKKLGQMSSKPE